MRSHTVCHDFILDYLPYLFVSCHLFIIRVSGNDYTIYPKDKLNRALKLPVFCSIVLVLLVCLTRFIPLSQVQFLLRELIFILFSHN